MMNRRVFGLALAGTLLFPSALIRAQEAKPRIALPFAGNEQTTAHVLKALKEGMREQGYPEETVEYDVRYARGQLATQEQMIAELVARKPDVIVVAGPPAVRAALKATRTIPIVMANVSDPVGNKFINSLARPGGNVTGIATLYETVLPKMAEILDILVPSASHIAVLVNESNPSTEAFWNSAEGALRALGKTPVRMNASSDLQLVDAFGRMAASRVKAALVVADPMFLTFRDHVAALARQHRVSAVYALREHVIAGGLASYGPNLPNNFRASARYVVRIIKGARPADLPVEQPTKFELVINRKAAHSLGIQMSPTIQLRADEMIE